MNLPQIIAHRGQWDLPAEKNSVKAFMRAFENGFGAEIDVRDLDGTLVVSHDPPRRGALRFERVLTAYRASGCRGPLAINIKACGLQLALKRALARFRIDNAFVFDMAVPDAMKYTQIGMRAFTRASDVEPVPAFFDRAVGVWLDGFESVRVSAREIWKYLDAGKDVCVVSPELHGRDPRAAWESIRRVRPVRGRLLMVCTDYPEEARVFFSGAGRQGGRRYRAGRGGKR